MTDLTFERGLQQLKTGDVASAKVSFEQFEASQGGASRTQGVLAAGEAAMAKGQWDVAATSFSQALERNPTRPESYVGLARVSLVLGQVADAEVHAKGAIKVGPQHALAWTSMGLVHETKNEIAQAISCHEKGAQLGPNVFLAQFNYGRVLIGERRTTEGIPFLLKAIELDAKNPEAHAMLGLSMMQTKQHHRALSSFETALSIDSRNPVRWGTLVATHFDMKQFEKGLEFGIKGLATVGDDPELLEKCAACATLLGRVETVVELLERQVKAAPDYVKGWYNLALYALQNGDVKRSEAAARQAIALDATHWESWFHLGNLYESINEDAKAEEAYSNANKLSPNNWRVLMNYGGLLVQSTLAQKHGEALQLLEKASQAAPVAEYRAHYNLALAHVRIGDSNKALALARQVQAEAQSTDAIVAEAKRLEQNILERSLTS
jgi:Tfp pilus assembly protein PilF